MKWPVFLVVLCLASPVRADVLYDNTGSGAGYDPMSWSLAEYTPDLGGTGLLLDSDLYQNFGSYGVPYEITTVDLALARPIGDPDAVTVLLASGSPYPSTVFATRFVSGTLPLLGSVSPLLSVDFSGEILPAGETLWVGISTVDAPSQLAWNTTSGVTVETSVALQILDGVASWIDGASTLALRVNVSPERPVATESRSWGQVKALY